LKVNTHNQVILITSFNKNNKKEAVLREIMNQNLPDGIVILDYGGQYCHLIARRVREMNVYSEILPSDSNSTDIRRLSRVMRPKGIILSGSPHSINIEGAPQLDSSLLDLDLPILGLCYGLQLLASLYKGKISKGTIREYGITFVKIKDPEGVLDGMDSIEEVWMSHGDTVFEAPENFKVLAYTNACPVAAMKHIDKPIYGLQWHPEVVHTKQGKKMLRNFLFKICKCSPNWKPLDTAESSIERIKEIVGNNQAIIALSGGVDSSVAAVLAARALDDKLVAIHVDHGLMRMNESEEVKKVFKNRGLRLIIVNAQDRFLKKLEGVIDPEKKRKLIGAEFIRVFEEEARKIGAEYLIQGTIYPDRIESGITKNSDTIKTHHNVGGLPLNIEFKEIIEPLKDLYKDEVRALGEKLELPKSLILRQPFPGPGLAVRLIGPITREKLEILRKADAIICQEIESLPYYDEIWQYFAILTNTKTTGVKGDERAYGWTLAIRVVESVDAMTANFSKLPWDILEKISNRVCNEIPHITRVVYDITHKPPATIEWE
jgi:GMP synthase (glutamine-hydrolysing)